MTSGFADQHEKLTADDGITTATIIKVFVVIAAVSFVLRIAYVGHLYEDDGFWFTVGEEVLRGKALYREVYFDKPPILALTYASLFWLFGAHILTIRLFTIAYSVAISAVLYLFGARLYGRRVGLAAAAMFAVFSTTYTTGHMQELSTELLMALPYTVAAYLFVRSREAGTYQRWFALTGGIVAGVAFQINPKAIVDLGFFAVLLIVFREWKAGRPIEACFEARDSQSSVRSRLRLCALAAAGFALSSFAILLYVAGTGSLREYWFYVWDWGARYASYYGVGKTVLSAVARGADYFLLNNTLLIGFAFLFWKTIRRFGRRQEAATEQAPGARFGDEPYFQSDVTLLLWFAFSYSGVLTGGRFFGHYFIQILPSLCLIGARGLAAMFSELRGQNAARRQLAIVIIALGFVLTIVRFHSRGALLAADYFRGSTSSANFNWYYNIRNREERMVAAVVRDLPEDIDMDRLPLEAIREREPGSNVSSADYLFVWGYRPEIYYWSGLLSASRFLSTQPLTGVPADVHYFGNEYRSLLDESTTAGNRAQLARDLEETRPKYIVDEIGFFNDDLSILRYPELQDVLSQYKPLGATARFFIYRRKELSEKYRSRHGGDVR